MISLLAGILLGLVAGLVPGLHPNFLAAILFSKFDGWWLFPTMISMLVSAQFFEFIRSTFLFVPEEGNVLAMHPIFRFVKEGKAIFAIKLCSIGLLSSILIGTVLSPILIKTIPIVLKIIKNYIPYLLLFISTYLILRERKPYYALLIFILSGILGFYGLRNLKQPLLVLLTGFFGLSILFQIRTKIGKQLKFERYKINKDSILRGSAAGLISSLLLAFVPAIGPAQASLFSRGLLKKREEFLVSIGAISGFDVIFSLILLFTIGKARIGALEIVGNKFTFNLNMLLISFFISVLIAFISYLITLKISFSFSNLFEKINYKYISIVVAISIFTITIYFDKILGILFLLAAVGVGLLANKLNVSLSHCMGSLVIPVLIALTI